VAVPGIDMANHSSTAANAAVRMQHSQDKQGTAGGTAAAAAAAAAAAGLTDSGSCFQLITGELGPCCVCNLTIVVHWGCQSRQHDPQALADNFWVVQVFAAYVMVELLLLRLLLSKGPTQQAQKARHTAFEHCT
jgi:hypothetical protein